MMKTITVLMSMSNNLIDREVGAGVTVFGDLNSENSFGGITASLIMGKLR